VKQDFNRINYILKWCR